MANTKKFFKDFTVPDNNRTTVGGVDFGTQVFQLQTLPWADIIVVFLIVNQPAIVHTSLYLAILILSIPLLFLSFLNLPAQLHHKGFYHHFCGTSLGHSSWGLIPPEPRTQRHGLCKGQIKGYNIFVFLAGK